MPYNLIFIDESESMQRAVATIFLDNPEFKLILVGEPLSLYEAAKNFIPDIIVLSYNTIDTELKKSITEIKTSKEFSNTLLVLLVPSDLSDNERETLLKLKADGFIYRPFEKDAFISKINRILDDNNTIAHAAGNAENSGNQEEKIYDISFFETKKIPPSDLTPAVSFPSAYAPDPNLTGLSAGERLISETASGLSANYASESINKEPEEVDSESSELNRAFETLFKDDKVFKEFNYLNEKEAQGGAGYVPDEEPPAAAMSSPPVEPAAPEEIFNPAPAEQVIPDMLAGNFEINKPALSAERGGASTFSEHFEEGFDIAPDNNPDELNELNELNELKAIINTNTKKYERGLNLKILDEQNIVKLDDYLENAIEKNFEDIKPEIIEIIKNSLPEIIERLVKEEIEKIKQQQ